MWVCFSRRQRICPGGKDASFNTRENGARKLQSGMLRTGPGAGLLGVRSSTQEAGAQADKTVLTFPFSERWLRRGTQTLPTPRPVPLIRSLLSTRPVNKPYEQVDAETKAGDFR